MGQTEEERMLSPEDRYKALLRVSDVLASHTDIRTVLHSLVEFLPQVVAFDHLAVILHDSKQGTGRLFAMESPVGFAGHTIGEEEPVEGTPMTTVLETQQPLIIGDVQHDDRFAVLVRKARPLGIRCLCLLPLTTARNKLGLLALGTTQREKYGAEEVELMATIASHLAIALENALTFEALQSYQKQLARERDRLQLLLEINNHIISNLRLTELFLAVSAALRRHFGHNFTGIWLWNEEAKQLQCMGLDFPDGRGLMEGIEPELDRETAEKLRTGWPRVISPAELRPSVPKTAEALLAEGIASIVGVPLRSSRRLLGVLSVGSVREDCFKQEDVDLLVQVAGQIALVVENALAFGEVSEARAKSENERIYLESEIRSEHHFDDIVGSSPAIREVLKQVGIVATTDASVLILGETGTGKELIARAIHDSSGRRDRTFVKLNCAAIPSGLVESELFGHERGAFTGALMQKIGRFELAHKGTLFLDEIGDMPLELQAKLLRALQEHEFERLGSNRTIHVDVRLIVATNRNLAAMIKNREFREDLFYRLNVFPIHIPPLRERRDDIPLLVRYFASRFAKRMGKNIGTIPEATLAYMSRWAWPGNIRELENFVERSVILTSGDTLQIPIPELAGESAAPQTPPDSAQTLHGIERDAIVNALRATQGRVAGPRGAAALLGLKRGTLQNKMRRLKITRDEGG